MEQISIPQVNYQYLKNLVNLYKNEFTNRIYKLTDSDIKISY